MLSFYINEFLLGFAVLVGYFVTALLFALLIKKLFIKKNFEIFRKILHLILLGVSFVLMFFFDMWYISVATVLIFAVLVYLALMAGEKLFKNYSKALAERRTGELRMSMLVVFIMYATVITVCWGLLNDRMLVFLCIFAWNIGDFFAALIGKKFGKHPLVGKMIEGKKSVEGAISMFIAAFISVFAVLIIRGRLPWYALLVIPVVVAVVVTVVELFTKRGFDTITCPLSAMVTATPLVAAFGGF